MCEAQETRGSKFTSEFGRNSTVYCFVASEIKLFTMNFAKQNLFKHGVLFDDVPRPRVLKPFVAVKAV